MTDAQRIERVWTMVRTVHDPELPYLTVEEMGMVRGVTMRNNQIVVSLTPTYSGCPATDVISEDVENAVKAVEPEAHVEVVLNPAWTTDWILPSAYEKMRAHGIAPPEGQSADRAFLTGQGKVIPAPLQIQGHLDGVCPLEARRARPTSNATRASNPSSTSSASDPIFPS